MNYKIENLTKKYNNILALNNISFEIKKSSIVAIVGKSGSGKSTLAKILVGLEKQSSGSFNFSNKEISLVMQEYSSSLNPKMSVYEILKEVYEIKKVKVNLEEIKKNLNLVGLDNVDLNLNVTKLSGGEKQRINIARALSLNTDIIVFDEAISSLDIHLQFQIINLIKKINKEMKKTILFITHDIYMIKFLTDDTIVLEEGNILFRGDLLKSNFKFINIWKNL